MSVSDFVDLLDDWSALGHRDEPPMDSIAVRLALSDLINVVEQFSRIRGENASAYRSTCGEPALAYATATLHSWWVAGPQITTITPVEWGEVERSVATMKLTSLVPYELARLCCLVAATRTIDDAVAWLRGEPGWAGVITYPGSIPVPESTWLCTDGDASNAWVSEVAAQLERYVGLKARSDKWLKARLLNDDGDRRGQLPGLLVCSWLLETKT